MRFANTWSTNRMVRYQEEQRNNYNNTNRKGMVDFLRLFTTWDLRFLGVIKDVTDQIEDIKLALY